jgi:hypothetical protein
MITGPAEEAVKKVVSANSRAMLCAAAISLRTEKEKNIKNGIINPNIIMGGVR